MFVIVLGVLQRLFIGSKIPSVAPGQGRSTPVSYICTSQFIVLILCSNVHWPYMHFINMANSWEIDNQEQSKQNFPPVFMTVASVASMDTILSIVYILTVFVHSFPAEQKGYKVRHSNELVALPETVG